jgi:transposase-like protein
VTGAVLAASCAQRAFGVETEKEFDEKRAKVVRRSFDPEDPVTRIEVAREHHVTAPTLCRWIREAKEDHPSISM